MSVEPRRSPETHPAVGTREVTAAGASVDPLVAVQDTRHSKGLPAGEADVLLLLRVDACVVAQSHGVCEVLGAERAVIMSSLMGVLVVEEAAGVTIVSITYDTCKGALLFI